jgi:mannose-6-phosphate isomerase-like protein (cupin superfamily)
MGSNDGRQVWTTIATADLDATIAELSSTLGVQLAAIFPADNPRCAWLEGEAGRFQVSVAHGEPVRFSPDTLPDLVPVAGSTALQTYRPAANDWVTGRAGMAYCDLIPGRLGGHLIASRIRIAGAGPVPDYVHHHHVHFQLIYCLSGRVRVVYEDQGAPFDMQPGDCVLQPPHIRHRVLESWDDLEVLEISCPAEHLTQVDAAMTLPTPTAKTEREFGGQRFAHFISAAGHAGGRPGAGTRHDLGVAAATHGRAHGVVDVVPAGDHDLGPTLGMRFVMLLSGGAELRTLDRRARISAGDCAILPTGVDVTLSAPAAVSWIDVGLRE